MLSYERTSIVSPKFIDRGERWRQISDKRMTEEQGIPVNILWSCA